MRSIKHIALLTWILWLLTIHTGLVAAPSCAVMRQATCPCCEEPNPVSQEMTCLASVERAPLLVSTIKIVAPKAASEWQGSTSKLFLELVQRFLSARSDQVTQRSLLYSSLLYTRDISLLIEVLRL